MKQWTQTIVTLIFCYNGKTNLFKLFLESKYIWRQQNVVMEYFSHWASVLTLMYIKKSLGTKHLIGKFVLRHTKKIAEISGK